MYLLYTKRFPYDMAHITCQYRHSTPHARSRTEPAIDEPAAKRAARAVQF